MPQFALSLKPIIPIVAVSSVSRTPQLVGSRRYLRHILFVEDECQVMVIEVLEPFFPRDPPKRSEAGKIESNAGAFIVNVRHGRP
jgi:hypothetical protein